MLWSVELSEAVLEATGHVVPTSFVESMNSYHDSDRLLDIGLIQDPGWYKPVGDWLQTGPYGEEGFVPFLVSDSNFLLIGCGKRFNGVIAAFGDVLQDSLGGLTHTDIRSFLAFLDRTEDHQDRDDITLFVDDGNGYDVIRDDRIVREADQTITAALGTDYDKAADYMAAASEDLAINLLDCDNYLIQEAAAYRLGRLKSFRAIGPLDVLAGIFVPAGQVNQHVTAAKRALKEIRRAAFMNKNGPHEGGPF